MAGLTVTLPGAQSPKAFDQFFDLAREEVQPAG